MEKLGSSAPSPFLSCTMSSARQAGNSSNRNTGHAPNGVCRNFWQDGRCRFGERCKYAHRRPGQPTPLVSTRSDASATANHSRLPLGSTNTLSNRERTTIESAESLIDAGQANVYLNRFCSSDGALKTSAQVKMLLKVIYGVASESSKWVCHAYAHGS